jgi:hypothetical protein
MARYSRAIRSGIAKKTRMVGLVSTNRFVILKGWVAEDFYGNNYPEDIVNSDDEHRRGAWERDRRPPGWTITIKLGLLGQLIVRRLSTIITNKNQGCYFVSGVETSAISHQIGETLNDTSSFDAWIIVDSWLQTSQIVASLRIGNRNVVPPLESITFVENWCQPWALILIGVLSDVSQAMEQVRCNFTLQHLAIGLFGI